VISEYATLVSSLAAFFASLSIVAHSIQIPLTSVGAQAMVGATARSHGVSGPVGKAAYAHAPYRKPALRYLYSVGWVGAASNIPKCQAALLLGGDPAVAAAQAIQGSPSLQARLRSARVSSSQASAAIGQGFHDGCQ
jgi:hypothetical protein